MMLVKWIQLLRAFIFFTCTCFAIGGSSEYLEVLTFNAALLETTIAKDNNTEIPNNREDRRDALIQYLNAGTYADIVCLQEVQFGQDLEKIVNEVSTTFPYAFSQLHRNGMLPPQSGTVFEPTCDPAAFIQLTDCAVRNGCLTGTRDSTLTGYNCLRSNCGVQFNTLLNISGEACLTCIGSNSPSNYDRCAGIPSPNLWNINKLGLLLLSKKPLYDAAAVEFYPDTLDTFVRGYLRVKAGDKDLTVACVHVSSSTFQIPPLNPRFLTLGEQNEAEIQLLVNAFSFVEPLVMLGDFNAGPGTLSINPIQQPAYENLAFFFETKLVREPTLSTDNQYNVGTTAPDTVLDHVFGDRRARIYNVKVVLKTDDISVAGDLPLSDHYGVEAFIKVRVCLKRRHY